jgi:alginate O-acetyltransferase complex protein AlgJ
MQRFIRKLVIFIGIPLLLNGLIATALPITLLNFRAWEALSPLNTGMFPGPFYPGQRVELVEEGDLGHGTQYAVPKEVVFITDSYGYRYGHSSPDHFDIVVVGDSFTVGSSLTQNDILSEVIARNTGETVYPLAPASMTTFQFDPRFVQNPPDVVILQFAERNLEPHKICPLSSAETVSGQAQLPEPGYQQMQVYTDRLVRTPLYVTQYALASYRRLGIEHNLIVDPSSHMLFLQSSIAMSPMEQLDTVAEEFQACNRWLNERGITLIVLPIPDKENIYYDLIPSRYRTSDQNYDRSQYMHALIQMLKDREIKVADTQTAYEQQRANGLQLYQQDDTHWNPDGVRIAAELIVEILSNP